MGRPVSERGGPPGGGEVARPPGARTVPGAAERGPAEGPGTGAASTGPGAASGDGRTPRGGPAVSGRDGGGGTGRVPGRSSRGRSRSGCSLALPLVTRRWAGPFPPSAPSGVVGAVGAAAGGADGTGGGGAGGRGADRGGGGGMGRVLAGAGAVPPDPGWWSRGGGDVSGIDTGGGDPDAGTGVAELVPGTGPAAEEEAGGAGEAGLWSGSSTTGARRNPRASALRRTRSAWASTMLDEWLRTPMPRASQRSSVSLLLSPSSRPSS